MRVAAIQMKAVLGAVDENCQSAERLVIRAIGQGARMVVLPEFFTSGMAYHPSLLDAVRPADGEPHELLCRLAKENQVVVGGSFIASRGAGVFNTFVLAFPDGSTFRHDKDLPSMWENCYYEPGTDDGVLETPVGAVGVAMCWELIRTQTVARLRGRIDLAIGGSCWWDVPYGEETPQLKESSELNIALYEKTPKTFARLLGVPFIHAAHTGSFEGLTPGNETRPYKSRTLGQAQIIDGHGTVLATATQDLAEDIVIADVTLGRVDANLENLPDTFWLHKMPEAMLAAWDQQNKWGHQYYHDITKPHRAKGR